jgi:RNA polymerase sigma-70 factor, ECF subfamily
VTRDRAELRQPEDASWAPRSGLRLARPRPRALVASSDQITQGARPVTESPKCDQNVILVNSGRTRASNRQAREADTEHDALLIQRAQQGDRQAFRELVDRHQRRAFAIALGLVRDEQDAREIVQEAFVRVFRGLDGFNGSSSFFTWLYRIVKNLAIDLLRRPSRRDAELVEGDADELLEPLFGELRLDDPAQTLARRQLADRIGRALETLPPYHRGVIVMREVEGMSYEEMAEAMGVSKGTIMSRLYHARRKLQRALRDCYTEQVGRPPVLEEEK